MENAVALAAIGLVGTILAVVVKPLFTLLRENTKATNALVNETKKGNSEAKQRNGHLAELVIDSKKATIDAITISEQHIEHQDIAVQEIHKVKK